MRSQSINDELKTTDHNSRTVEANIQDVEKHESNVTVRSQSNDDLKTNANYSSKTAKANIQDVEKHENNETVRSQSIDNLKTNANVGRTAKANRHDNGSSSKTAKEDTDSS